MSAEWNDQTLDDILSDVERMTRERGEAEASDQPMHAWTLSEVDALLDEDNALAGFADYGATPETDFPEWPRRGSAAPVPAREPEENPFAKFMPEPEASEEDLLAKNMPEPAGPEEELQQESGKGAAFSRLFSHRRKKDTRPQPEAIEPETQEAAQVPFEPEMPAEAAAASEPETPQAVQIPFEPETPAEAAAPSEPEMPQAVQIPFEPEIPAETAASFEPEIPAEPETPAEPEEKTRVIEKTIVAPPKPMPKPPTPKPKKQPDPEMVDGQMMLSGFEAEDDVEQVDEAQAEKELKERRKKQIKKFRLYDMAERYEPDLPPKTDVFEPEPEPSAETDDAGEDEYVRLNDRMRIGRILQENRRSAFLSVCVLGVVFIVLVVLAALSANATADGRSILYAISIVLLSLSAVLSISTFRKGLTDLIRWKPSCDSAALLATAATLIQSAVSFIVPASGQTSGTFCAAAVFSLLLCRIAKLFETVGIVSNFKFCAFAAADHLFAIRAFEREADAFEVGKALEKKHPKLRFSQKTRFPATFRKQSDFRSAMDRICKILLPAGFGAALIMAVAGWIKTSSAVDALNAFTGALCVALPVGAAFTVSVPLVLLMQNLNRHGGMIASPEAARENAGVHGVAVDAVDLFDRKHTDVYCFQDYGALHFDAMYLYAAALAIGAHSPAESAFLHAVGNPDILPPVQGLIYEERLGISATINRKSVLLGNRNLLTTHSIDPPPKSGEVPYLQQNKRVLYLAVDGKVAGMFVIDYVQKKALCVPLQILQDNDTNLLVYAPDSNVTEDFISASFRLRKGGVQLLSPTAGRILREQQAQETEHMPATAMHNGTAESLMRTLADAAVMQNIQRVAAFIGVIGCAIGWLVSFILLLAKGAGAMNWIFATVYPAVWMTLSAALGIWQARKAMK